MRPSAKSGDRIWLLVLAASFAVGVAASWQRWGGPLIDTGREMNQPLRLAAGERLYSDVRHIYGPLSPWLHAGLFRVFGASLNVLYADGLITAVLILALTYWLARRIMDPAAAGVATLSVMWLCVFKPAGNYILPYSYSALHGAGFSLVTLAFLATALDSAGRESRDLFLAAGVAAGLALLAKTEMGVAALVAGITAAAVSRVPDARRKFTHALLFLTVALSLALGVYAIIAARVGWSTLVSDSWLLAYNVPPELAYYNRRISGLDRPLASLARMSIAGIKLGILAIMIGAVSRLLAGTDAAPRAWRALAAGAVLAIVTSLTVSADWDKGPYLAMPLLLAGMLAVRRTRTPILITYAAFALASLSRMILHVRSGGAYGSFVLPVSVILFTYLWIGPFAEAIEAAPARRVFRTLTLGLMLAIAVATAGVLAYRYRTINTGTIQTARGSMKAPADVAQAWNEALAFIERRTRPGDAVAVMPEGTSLDFMSGRRNPLREEITTPGYLDDVGELRAIRQLEHAHTSVILITDRLTEEFGAAVFGRDYCLRLMQWIDAHYSRCGIFGPRKNPEALIGEKPFFIKAYCSTPL